MYRTLRFVGLTVMSVFAVVLMALSTTTSTLYALTAATYIFPGSLGTPFTDRAKEALAELYIGGTMGYPAPPPLQITYRRSALPSPQEIEPDSVVFGYSVGASAVNFIKSDFNEYWTDRAENAPDLKFVMIGNTRRPNGGYTGRLGLGYSPTETAGAGPGEITTYDIVRQYDGAADSPTNPTNLLAYANAMAGILTVHLDYGSVDMDDALPQGTYGDTEYYLVPTYPLPLLMPVQLLPGIGPLLADSLDPVVRVLVEAGYDRTINPGEPAGFNVFYSPNPVTLMGNLLRAIQVGQDNWSENLGQGRPLGTVRPGPYGVGGPDVSVDSAETDRAITASSSPEVRSAEPAGEAPIETNPKRHPGRLTGRAISNEDLTETPDGTTTITAPVVGPTDNLDTDEGLVEGLGDGDQAPTRSSFRQQIERRPILRSLVEASDTKTEAVNERSRTPRHGRTTEPERDNNQDPDSDQNQDSDQSQDSAQDKRDDQRQDSESSQDSSGQLS